MRRTIVTVLIVLAVVGLLGYLAHTFDLLGLAKSLHAGAAQQH